MNASNDLKICVCGAMASVFISSIGPYFCEKCSEEKHYHEPVKSQNILIVDRGSSLPTGTASISPRFGKDGSS